MRAWFSSPPRDRLLRRRRLVRWLRALYGRGSVRAHGHLHSKGPGPSRRTSTLPEDGQGPRTTTTEIADCLAKCGLLQQTAWVHVLDSRNFLVRWVPLECSARSSPAPEGRPKRCGRGRGPQRRLPGRSPASCGARPAARSTRAHTSARTQIPVAFIRMVLIKNLEISMSLASNSLSSVSEC